MTDTPQSAPARRATSDAWTSVERAGAALNGTATRAFRWSADAIMKLLVPLAILALVMGFARIVLDLGKVYRTPSITAGFEILVTDILSMFVVIELLKSIVEYFEAHRLKLTFIVDGALVFVLREVMIALYQHAASPGQLGALAAARRREAERSCGSRPTEPPPHPQPRAPLRRRRVPRRWSRPAPPPLGPRACHGPMNPPSG